VQLLGESLLTIPPLDKDGDRNPVWDRVDQASKAGSAYWRYDALQTASVNGLSQRLEPFTDDSKKNSDSVSEDPMARLSIAKLDETLQRQGPHDSGNSTMCSECNTKRLASSLAQMSALHSIPQYLKEWR